MKALLKSFTISSFFVLSAALAGSAAITAGCVKPIKEVRNSNQSAIDSATTLMDQGKYAEAESNLQKLILDHPEDSRFHVLLSNVYVRWAGIKFNDFVPLAKFYIDQEKNKSQKSAGSQPLIDILGASDSESSSGFKGKTATAVETLARLLTTLDTAILVFDKIPEVDEANYGHFSLGLAQAIEAGSENRGDVLYRALLRVIDLKFHWKNGGDFQFMNEQCKVIPAGLIDFLNGTFSRYQEIATDLKIVYPNLSAPLEKGIEQFKKIAPELKARLIQAQGSDAQGEAVKSVWQCI